MFFPDRWIRKSILQIRPRNDLRHCSLIEQVVNHAAHHKHSYYLVRHGELLGYTETELEIIANIARYHRRSAPKKKHENYRILSKNSRHLVNQASAFLRLAVALDRRQIGAISQLRCDFNSTSFELHLHLKPAHLNDDCALELWSFEMKICSIVSYCGVVLHFFMMVVLRGHYFIDLISGLMAAHYFHMMSDYLSPYLSKIYNLDESELKDDKTESESLKQGFVNEDANKSGSEIHINKNKGVK